MSEINTAELDAYLSTPFKCPECHDKGWVTVDGDYPDGDSMTLQCELCGGDGMTVGRVLDLYNSGYAKEMLRFMGILFNIFKKQPHDFIYAVYKNLDEDLEPDTEEEAVKRFGLMSNSEFSEFMESLWPEMEIRGLADGNASLYITNPWDKPFLEDVED